MRCFFCVTDSAVCSNDVGAIASKIISDHTEIVLRSANVNTTIYHIIACNVKAAVHLLSLWLYNFISFSLVPILTILCFLLLPAHSWLCSSCLLCMLACMTAEGASGSGKYTDGRGLLSSIRRERVPLQEGNGREENLIIWVMGNAFCLYLLYTMCWWCWLALIIPITSPTLPETRDSSVIACIFSTTSAQHRRGGKEDVLNELTPQCSAEDVSNSSTNSWEEYTHTHNHHWEEHCTANHRPAAKMLGQPGQSALRVPYKRQPVFQATHRCVSQRLPQHIQYVQLQCYIATQEVCLLKLSSSCRS